MRRYETQGIGRANACKGMHITRPWMLNPDATIDTNAEIICEGFFTGKKITLTPAHCICNYKNTTTNPTIETNATESLTLDVWIKNERRYISFHNHDRTRSDRPIQKRLLPNFIPQKHHAGTLVS